MGGLPLLLQSLLQTLQTSGSFPIVMASPERVAIDRKSPLGYVVAFILHTFVVYTCATNVSQWAGVSLVPVGGTDIQCFD
jgi:hypothetical protein